MIWNPIFLFIIMFLMLCYLLKKEGSVLKLTIFSLILLIKYFP